jgi:LPXTG-motif cell wall-anchored protein
VTADPDRHTVPLRRAWDLIAVAGFTILAGFAEVVTGFSHTFFGITTSGVALFTVAATGIGLSYLASGVLILTMKRWAATVALIFLGIDIVGRILLAVTGLYPTDTANNTFSLIAGTLIVAFVALYVAWKRKTFT